MTTTELALAITELDTEEMDEVMEAIYQSGIDVAGFSEDLLELGVSVSKWCKRKHPPVE